MNDEYITSRDSYGLLITPDIKLHRQYFKEMVRLLGVNCIYRAPVVSDKHYTLNGEVETQFQAPQVVGCLFEDHPTQKTTKKLGWNSEQMEGASIIHVPYDLKDLQQGALFIVPSAFDNTKGRLFRVDELSSIMIYPASISCKIVPEYEDTFDKSQLNHSKDNFNLLDFGEEDD